MENTIGSVPSFDPLVTVIVATYNAAGTLQRCLDSIRSQAWPRKELIIIDGASTDQTVDLIKANAGMLAYWMSEPDHGLYDAWNKALPHAGGDYICFLGADDHWHARDSLEKLVRLAQASGFPDLVCGKVAIVDAQGLPLTQKGAAWNFSQMKKFMNVAHPGMLHHRRIFARYGSFSNTYKIAGDYDFLLRLPAETTHAFIPEPIVDMGSGGLSRTKINKVFVETYQIQSRNKNIGPFLASLNYFIAYAKYFGKRLLCRI